MASLGALAAILALILAFVVASRPVEVTVTLSDDIAANLLERFESNNPELSPTVRADLLAETARDVDELESRLASLAELDAQTVSRATQALNAGDFVGADEILADAEGAHRNGVALPEVRRQAEIRIARADVALLGGDATEAAEHFDFASGYIAPFDADEAARIRHEGATRLAANGRWFGGAGLAVAVELYRANLAHWTYDEHPDEWLATTNNLGVALLNLGERQSGEEGASMLTEAVVVLREVLASLDPETRQDDWAATQRNVGLALTALGERMGGDEGRGGFLEDAELALRAALTVYMRSTHPVDWAATQSGLGAVLNELISVHEGTRRIDLAREAEQAFRAALEVRTRAAYPEEWALTQHNLGVTLLARGSREGPSAATSVLGEAVAAFEAALEVRSPDTDPMGWASSQNSLGNALNQLAARTGGAQESILLEDAVEAYLLALRVYSRDTNGVDWTMVQNNLGSALVRQGQRLEGAAQLEVFSEAVAAFRASLGQVDREAQPIQWAETQDNLGMALAKQCLSTYLVRARAGELENAASEICSEAVEKHEAVLEIRTRDASPVEWARTQVKLAEAFAAMATMDVSQEVAYYEEAVTCLELALEVLSPASTPYAFRDATEKLTFVRGVLAQARRRSG